MKIDSKVSAKSGTTMVEVIVAFAVLMVCIAMITTCVELANAMQNHAADRRRLISELEESVYSTGGTLEGSVEESWSFSGYGVSFSIPVRVESRSVSGSGGSISYHSIGKK